MTATTTRTVSFGIDAAWLTARARDRVVEGDWEHALRILVEGLEGMTYEYALSILNGEKMLTGTSREGNIMMVDQDPEDEEFLRYKKTFDFQFAGVLKLESGRLVRPYAVVDSYGQDDFRSKLRYEHLSRDSDFFQSRPVRFHDILGKDPIDWAYRSLFYADRPHDDVVKKVQLPGYHGTHLYQSVLWETVHDYPKLLAPHVTRDPQVAIDAAIKAGRKPERRGYAYNRPEVSPTDEYMPVTSSQSDNLPAEWVIPNPDYIPPPVVKQPPADSLVSASNRIVKESVDEGVSISTAIALAQAKMALMGGLANDPAKRLEAINAAFAAKEEEAEGKSIEQYRKAITTQANGDYFDLAYTDREGKAVVLKVPSAPFEQWVLWRTAGSHLAKPWKRVTYSGMKMFGDDPYHTDWVIGAGLHPDDWPSHSEDPLHKAAWDARFALAESKMGGNMVILLGTGFVEGKIKMLKPGETVERGEIGVIRNAGPDYVQAAQSAIDNNTALICENGGVVAHLVTVYRDKPLRLVRVADARKIFKNGMSVGLDLDKAKRTIYEGMRGPEPGSLYLPPEWEIYDDL